MTQTAVNQINFADIPIVKDWSFSDKTIRDTAYITHSYYTYPAKFIPQLASRLIKDYSEKGDIIVDTFMGSGTTIVEAIINERIGIGTDINPIAHLVSKVKTTPIADDDLVRNLNELYFKIQNNSRESLFNQAHNAAVPTNERLDFWYKPEQKEKLAGLLSRISEVEHKDCQDFFLVCFAQILKSCSIWLQKSVKPTRDFTKKDIDPIDKFFAQAKTMLKKHREFNLLLSAKVRDNIDKFRVVRCADSRNQPCGNGEASLVVTSPPYVTSYEYADLHQLPVLWFGYLENLAEFRKTFIGSAYKERQAVVDVQSKIALEIVQKFSEKKKAKEVEIYFADMLETFCEMHRVLKTGGKACVVIGNTKLRGVSILNAEVFQEQMQNIGFQTFDIIHREIPSKMLPSTRNEETGKFTKTSGKNMKLAYPTEYILVMQKVY